MEIKSLPKYDTSKKEYEVQKIEYKFDKYTRKYKGDNNFFGKWTHYKHYKTESQALDAIRDFRRSFYDLAYRDYPAMFGGIEQEKIYPHIKPTITIQRYRIVKRKVS